MGRVRDERPAQRRSTRSVAGACAWPGFARNRWRMELRRALAGPGAIGRYIRRHVRAIWIWLHLPTRRIRSRYHQGWRASSFPLDDRRHRRSIKMVQRNRITRQALQETFDQLPKEHNAATKSFALACAVTRGF